jgi:hypothetical protein
MLPGSYDHFPEDPRNEPDAIEEAEARGFAQRSDVEQPEVDDRTLSDVIRKPTRTSGDLSEVAEGSVGFSVPTRPIEDSPVFDPPVDRERLLPSDVVSADDVDDSADLSSGGWQGPTDREILKELLERVERIEQHLGISPMDGDVE